MPLTKDEIFSLKQEFEADPRPDKINGGIGVYLDNHGQPFVLPVVKQAIKLIDLSSFNYLPISGDHDFLETSTKLVLGKKLYHLLNPRIAKQGVAGGTNGLFTWALSVKQTQPHPTIIISQPTWSNHLQIFSFFGFKIIEYSHLTADNQFDFKALKSCLLDHPEAFILFQAGLTHNPTGVNPNIKEWQELAKIIKHNHNSVIFDYSYMGLGDDIPTDSYCIRLFTQKKIPISVVVSYSKNMTLYQHRSGMLFSITSSVTAKETLETNYQYLFRISVSNPPALGEFVVETIFSDKHLKSQWLKSLSAMAHSLRRRRRLFVRLVGREFNFVKHQHGLYSLLNLSVAQINLLKQHYGIYLLSNGRLNFGGLSLADIPRLAQAIKEINETTH